MWIPAKCPHNVKTIRYSYDCWDIWSPPEDIKPTPTPPPVSLTLFLSPPLWIWTKKLYYFHNQNLPWQHRLRKCSKATVKCCWQSVIWFNIIFGFENKAKEKKKPEAILCLPTKTTVASASLGIFASSFIDLATACASAGTGCRFFFH